MLLLIHLITQICSSDLGKSTENPNYKTTDLESKGEMSIRSGRQLTPEEKNEEQEIARIRAYTLGFLRAFNPLAATALSDLINSSNKDQYETSVDKSAINEGSEEGVVRNRAVATKKKENEEENFLICEPEGIRDETICSRIMRFFRSGNGN